jgi:parvulin-like peptidyl-prolyl isomerase
LAAEQLDRVSAAARAGKSFGGLIDAISDDHPLVTRKGTSKRFNASDALPDELKQAIARGKAGEVVGPFAGGDGQFVCRIVGVKPKPFGVVREQVIEDIKDAKMKDWIESLKREIEIRDNAN